MSQSEPPPIEIRPAPVESRSRALQLVFRDQLPALRHRQTAQTLDELRSRPAAGDGLLTAWTGELLAGAVLIQLQPGRVGSLWPPQVATDQVAGFNTLARRLLRAAIDLAVRADSRIIQALLPTDSGHDARRLRAAGFEHVSDLLYLVSDPNGFPSTHPDDALEYVQFSSDIADDFAAIVERTYSGTQDCPRLNGVRPIHEVLEGYRAVGRFDPMLWQLVRHQRNEIGCLLLAEHAPHNMWEIVYMGIVPEARGQGFGLAVTRHAQWLASKGGAERLVLAVDAANEPAIKGYAAAGFTTWDRRSVFLKVLT
jgi:ribosomal protein S18 acetylase RimI-like enzyme